MEQLTPIQVRILGALIEKEATTPDQYPLTLNSLKNACNQKTSRFPVTSYYEGEIGHTLRELESMDLVATAWGARASKYEHRFAEAMDLRKTDQAVLCTLMLRGPQTAAEIRAHCARIHEFDDVDDVEYCLTRLAERDEPLVVKLSRQAGQKGERFAHLLCGEPELPAEPAQTAGVMPVSPLEERVAELEEKMEALLKRLEDGQID